MPSPETIELIHVKNTQGELTDLPSNNAMGTISAKIKNLLLTASNLPSLEHDFGGSFPNKSLTLDIGEDQATSMFSDGTFLYVGTFTTPGKIVKIDLSTFTRYDTITFNAGENFVNALVADGTNLYTILNSGQLIKINLQTFSREATITLIGLPSNTNNMYLDGTYLYIVGSFWGSAKIVRVELETFTEISTLTLVAAEEKYISGITGDGGYLYLGCYSLYTSPRIVRIDIATFTRIDALTIGVINGSNTSNIEIYGKYIYFRISSIGILNDFVCKVDLYTFSVVSILSVTKATYGYLPEIASDGTYLYVTTSLGYIVIIDLASFVTKQITSSAYGVLCLIPPFLFIASITFPIVVTRRYLLPYSTSFDIQISVIHEQTNTGTYYIIPSNAAGITISSGVGAYTKGAVYTEIIAVNTVTMNFYIDSIFLNTQTVNRDFEIDIATGLAGFEVIIATVSNMVSNTNDGREYKFNPQIKVPANTRISANCSDSTGSGSVNVKIRYRI